MNNRSPTSYISLPTVGPIREYLDFKMVARHRWKSGRNTGTNAAFLRPESMRSLHETILFVCGHYTKQVFLEIR